MKNLRKFLIIGSMFALVAACGPTAEEQAEEKRLDSLKQDSIMKVTEQVRLDSIAKVEQIRIERDKFVADSLHQDSVANGLVK